MAIEATTDGAAALMDKRENGRYASHDRTTGVSIDEVTDRTDASSNSVTTGFDALSNRLETSVDQITVRCDTLVPYALTTSQ